MSDLAKMLLDAAANPITDSSVPVLGSLSDVFNQEVVDLSTFVNDKKYLGSEFELSPIQYDVVRHMERVLMDGWTNVDNPDGTVSRVYNEDNDIYKRMGEEMNSYWAEPYRMVNFVNCLWGKGSLSPNVRIYNTETGTWPTLKEFMGGKVAAAYKEDGKVFIADATAPFVEGHGKMFKVTTKKGFTVDVWEGHRFLTWANNKPWPGGSRARLGVSEKIRRCVVPLVGYESRRPYCCF